MTFGKMKPNRIKGIICAGCKEEIKIGENKIMHHTSYFPEVKVPVHKSCHAKIHWGTDYQELAPDYRQTVRFYNYNQDVRNNLNVDIPDFFSNIENDIDVILSKKNLELIMVSI